MDRLLTPNEQPNIPQDAFSIYDWKTALQIESHINEVKKLQDAKTASLVAQEIISKFNTIYYYGTCVHPAIREDEEVYIIRKQDWEAIKSKWGGR